MLVEGFVLHILEIALSRIIEYILKCFWASQAEEFGERRSREYDAFIMLL
jgi:hypothetical protein